jgi:hypothetical protein
LKRREGRRLSSSAAPSLSKISTVWGSYFDGAAGVSTLMFTSVPPPPPLRKTPG